MLRIARLAVCGLLAPILIAATSSPLELGPTVTLGAASTLNSAHGTSISPSDFKAEVNSVIGLRDCDVQRLHLTEIADGQYELTVQIGDQQRRIRYVEHSIRTDSYQLLSQAPDGTLVEIPAGPVNTYRGVDASWPDMKSAMSIEDDGFRARFLCDDGEQWWLEPLIDRVRGADASDYVVYRGEDVIYPAGFCGVTDKHGTAFPASNAPAIPGSDRVVLAAEFVVDTDYEYYQSYGSESSVENRVNSIVNSFNLQYESQVEIVNELQAVVVRSNSNDPYSSNSIETRLEQVGSVWNSTNNPPHDIVQLFSGVSFSGSTIGLAWLGAVCSTYEYSVVESDCCGAFACATDLSAHELGHNWGAGHCNCPGNTMNPSITCANDFASSTIGSITSFRNSIASCLSDVYGGVCCFQDQCFDSIAEEGCTNVGGVWNANQTCGQVDCITPDPTGACCASGSCTIRTEAECNGDYLGDDSTCSGNPCSGGSGDDAFIGLSYSIVGSNLVDDDESTWTVDIYAHLLGDCRLDAIAGDTTQDKMVSTTGSFYQNIYGGPTSQAINPALFNAFPDLRYDSFVTVGRTDQTDNAMSSIGIDFSAFEAGGAIDSSDGSWYVTPEDAQGDGSTYVNEVCEDANGVLIARLTVRGATASVYFEALFQGKDETGSTWQTTGALSIVNDDCNVQCTGDYNGDGVTNVSDLLDVIAGWNNPYDVNDLLAVIADWSCGNP